MLSSNMAFTFGKHCCQNNIENGDETTRLDEFHINKKLHSYINAITIKPTL